MSARVNPYAPDGLPRRLVGRDHELGLAAERLHRLADAGSMPGGPLVFTAPRGVGKTSLLRAIEAEAMPGGFAVAWVAVAHHQPLLPELARALDDALTDIDLDGPSGASPRIERFRLEIGVTPVKAGLELTRATPPAALAQEGTVAATAALLRATSSAVRARGGGGIVLLIDEVHELRPADAAVLWNALQVLAAHPERAPLAVFAAGLPSAPAALARAATFAERTSFVELPLLDSGQSTRALTSPAADLGVPWTDGALRRAEEIARGYPYLLQLIGWAAWDLRRPAAGEAIDAGTVDQAQVEVQERLTRLFRSRWDNATATERQFLAAMAGAGGEVVLRADLARILGRESRSLSDVRTRLIDRGIVEAAGRGRLRFTIPGFGEYLRAEVHALAEPESPKA